MRAVWRLSLIHIYRDLLISGHEREEVVDALLHGQCGIVEGVTGLLGEGRREGGGKEADLRGELLDGHGG